MRSLNPERLDNLLLARLAVRATRPPTPAAVARALYGFVSRDLRPGEWSEVFAQALARLRAQGSIELERLVLTARGKARLLAALRLRALPGVASWAQFKSRYLPRLFLESLDGQGDATPSCAAVVLAERLGVACTAHSTPRQVVDLWLAKKLGVDALSLEQLRNVLLAKELQVPRRKRSIETLHLGIAHLSGASDARSATVVSALATRWLRAEPAERQAQSDARPAAGELGEFVQRVQAAAASQRVRSYGDNKVFIGSVWQVLSADAEIAKLGEAGFKSRLLEAHRCGALVLGRADLVGAMDARDVRASEIHHHNATYHFIHRGQPA